jgi:hypothetical protein
LDGVGLTNSYPHDTMTHREGETSYPHIPPVAYPFTPLWWGSPLPYPPHYDILTGGFGGTNRLFEEIDEAIYYNLISCLESMNLGGMVREAQSMFKDRYPEYASTHESIGNEHITSLMSMSQNPDLENVVSWMINGMDDGDVLIVDKK